MLELAERVWQSLQTVVSKFQYGQRSQHAESDRQSCKSYIVEVQSVQVLQIHEEIRRSIETVLTQIEQL